MMRYGLKARLAAAGATALLLAACEDRGRPVAAPEPASLAELEAVSELPYAEPARVEYLQPERGYQWAERAYGQQRAFYDAPPDYGFYYDEVEPYVWETADDWALYAEPWEGDYRYYYYEPGAAFPYFVRDREYGYAYGAAGVLIAVFDAGGRYLPADVAYRVAPTAGRYYARGHDLRRADGEARRIRIDDRTWATEGPRVSRSASPWLRAARDDRGWRAWRERDGDRELARFQAETRRRQDVAQAWRERTERQQAASSERRDDRLEADALRARRAAMRDERQDRRADVQAARAEAQSERQRAEVAAQAQRRQAGLSQRAERREQVRRQAQAEQGRQRQAERQRAQAEQRQQAQAQAQAQRQQAQAERQARAPSAGESGKPAATRERGASKERGPVNKDQGRGHGKKD